MSTRRVVTGKNAAGKSVFISDGTSPREMALQHTPGFVSAPQWKIDATPDLAKRDGADPMASEGTMLASVGGSVFWMIRPKFSRLLDSGLEAIATRGVVGKATASSLLAANVLL